MIENPIIQAVVLILFGISLGMQLSMWYWTRIAKNVFFKLIAVLGIKLKATDMTAKQAWIIINNIASKLLEEVEDEEGKKTFKNKITKSPK